GAGGRDYLDGRGGNDTVQGGATQVVFLDFDSAFSPDEGDYPYTPAERDAIQARLEAIYSGFDFTFTQSRSAAQALTHAAGGQFVALVYNDGPGGDIGGQSSERDPGNVRRGGAAAINVVNLLGGAGQPDATSAN